MFEGEPGERVVVLESGRVKVTRTETGGHETLLSIRDPGDLAWIHRVAPRFPSDGES